MSQHARTVDAGEIRVPMKKSASRNLKFSFGHNHLFGSLSPETLETFRKNQVTQFFPAGAIVLGTGETPKGIYVVHTGKIKMSMPGRNRPASRVAGRGEILGLIAMVSGKPCEVTSEAVSPAQLTFIPRNAIIRLMDEDSEFAFRILLYLCNDLGDAFESVRSQLRPPRRIHKST
jgi:CRP-like cAMP-binding protein